MTHDARLAEEFEAARPMLTGLAYRILGSIAEAEDIVQDTFLSWMKADRAAIDRPDSWLTTVCTRKAVDVLRSARHARTTYVGAWLPEPIHTQVLDTPETNTALSQTLTTAFMLVLERLAPKERAAFLLHEVFGESYEAVATCLDISQPACRKLVSRARANIQQTNKAYVAPRERQDELVAAFNLAISTGSTDRLANLLSSEATLSADSGGKVTAIRRTLEGPVEILDFVGRVLSPVWRDNEIVSTELNSGRAIVMRENGRTTAIVTFAYDDDLRASSIFIVRNPDKLASMDREPPVPD